MEVRYAARALRKSPVFALGVVLTLALAVGAVTAVFSVVHAVLLRPLPYVDPSRVVAIHESAAPNDAARRSGVSPANFRDWRDQLRSFTAIGASMGSVFNLAGPDGPVHLYGNAVSAGYFPALGIKPNLGRTFLPEEDRPSALRTVLLSASLWRRRFNSDPSISGKVITLNGSPYSVIGVMPLGRPDPQDDFDLWVPLENQILPERMRWRHERFLAVLGRLRPGVGINHARAELNAIQASLKQTYPESKSGAGVAILPLQESLAANIRSSLLSLFAAVALVLLIACANVANLMLVRAGGRRRELSIRSALGASRPQLLVQLLLESLFLSGAAAALGALFAAWTLRFLIALSPVNLGQFGPIGIDPAVFAFSLAVALTTGLLFGLFPGLGALRGGLQLRGASGSSALPAGGRRLQRTLAIAEIALALVLLTGAGLLVRTFTALNSVPLGFSTRNIVTARIALPRSKYSQDRDCARFYARALEQVRTVPGVADAGLTTRFPLTGGHMTTSVAVDGQEPPPEALPDSAALRFIDSRYLSVLSIPLRSGRFFSDQDRDDSAPVAIVSESLAHRYWPRQNPLDRRVTVSRTDYPRTPRTIVGIVGDVRTEITEEPLPTIYVPFRQMAFHGSLLAIRTTIPNPPGLALALRHAIQTVDPDQPLLGIHPLDEIVFETVRPWRFALTLMSGLAGLALVLAVVGVFGVIACLVARRTQEFGVRMALGATSADIARLVAAHGLRLAIIGVGTGLLLATALTRLMRTLLYGVAPTDPLTFAAVPLLLTLATMLACLLPARRASRLDPLAALRDE